MQVKCFQFNGFMVNTYILYDETKEAIVIDAGMSNDAEEKAFNQFITDNNLTIKEIVNTHAHIDHVIGNGRCQRAFHAPIAFHEEGLPVYESACMFGNAYMMPCALEDFPPATRYVKEGDELCFGNQRLKVLYVPGHAIGSIALYSESAQCVFVGDVLFEGSIGRSDLPTGHLRTLLNSIKTRLLTLPDDTIVYSGHGNPTTIGRERRENHYILVNKL